MTDPRELLVRKIAIEEAKVRHFDGFIFLCGGIVDASSQQPTSLRDAIYREAVKHPEIENKIRLAEEFKEWAEDGHYRDLLTFEEHIAELSEVIVLALESPGAIAELGLFSAMESFRSKLIVFVATTHYEESSFIKLGPIKFLEETHENPPEVFPWITGGFRKAIDIEWLTRSSHEVFEAIRERLKGDGGETPFDHNRWLHTTLLICDLIKLMSALTITEISKYISAIGINETQSQTKQRLFILERLGIIKITYRSREKFYIPIKDRNFINFRINPKDLDLTRIHSDVISFYEKTDKRRHRAIIEQRRIGA